MDLAQGPWASDVWGVLNAAINTIQVLALAYIARCAHTATTRQKVVRNRHKPRNRRHIAR